MRSISRETILVLILMPLWILGGGFTMFKAERTALRLSSVFMGMNYGEKAGLVAGPVYGLFHKALEIIPEGRTVYFIYDPRTGKNDNYSGKIRYYLYPRTVIDASSDIMQRIALKDDSYLMIYYPGNSQYAFDISGSDLTLEKLYERRDASSYWAIYRIAKRDR